MKKTHIVYTARDTVRIAQECFYSLSKPETVCIEGSNTCGGWRIDEKDPHSLYSQRYR